ncbi:MAG: glycosyltransferase family 9 protein [Deferrisomatales bacterium]
MRVLLVRLSSLGDVVLATAAVEALRQDLPDAEVEVLTKPAFREVFAGNPGVRGLLPWDPGQGLGALARLVRTGGFDWVVDLHGNLRTRALRLLCPGVRWSGYPKGALRRRLAVALRRPGLLGDRHVVDRYLAALAPLGVSPARRLPRVYPGEAARAEARRLLDAAGWDGASPLVALAPGARWATKAWPARSWVGLARKIGEAGRFVALVGAAGERDLCRGILEGAAVPGANLAGQTSILETAAVLEASGSLVANDSAPLHLATAVGTRVVALFGPTVRGFGFYPLGPADAVVELELGCRPCSLHGDPTCPRGERRCLDEVAPEVVFQVLHGGHASRRAAGGGR